MPTPISPDTRETLYIIIMVVGFIILVLATVCCILLYRKCKGKTIANHLCSKDTSTSLSQSTATMTTICNVGGVLQDNDTVQMTENPCCSTAGSQESRDSSTSLCQATSNNTKTGNLGVLQDDNNVQMTENPAYSAAEPQEVQMTANPAYISAETQEDYLTANTVYMSAGPQEDSLTANPVYLSAGNQEAQLTANPVYLSLVETGYRRNSSHNTSDASSFPIPDGEHDYSYISPP